MGRPSQEDCFAFRRICPTLYTKFLSAKASLHMHGKAVFNPCLLCGKVLIAPTQRRARTVLMRGCYEGQWSMCVKLQVQGMRYAVLFHMG